MFDLKKLVKTIVIFIGIVFIISGIFSLVFDSKEFLIFPFQ